MRENKDHRTLALKDFQDQDIKAVLERPAFCQKKHRENKELELFCKDCKVAICSACAMTLHDNHVKMLLQEATDARKTQIKSIIKSLKDKEVEKQEEVEQFNQKSIAFQSKVAEVKSQVQSCVDQIIAIIEARKQDIFDVIDNQAKKSLESFSHKKDELNKQVKLIELAIEQAETLLKQSFSTEILGFSETFDSILQEQSTQENRDTECIPRFSFTKSKKLINLLSMSEGIGKVEFVFSEIKAQQLGTKGKESSKVIAGNKGANVHDSPFEAQVQTRCFRSVLSFGRKGKSVGMLNSPWGVAVNDQDEIAVTEYLNHRVSVFSSDGIHLRSFGRCGDNKGEFWYPKGIAFDSHGNIVVADCWNHRVQVFDWNGNFLSMFGVNQLQYPAGLSINGNGDIIVADGRNILIKIFSSSGEYLRKFSGAGSLVSPIHCIQHGQYFIVLDFGDHSIKIFSLEERFISKFGKRGNKDGEFNKPRYLSVNKEGLLMVCDEKNHRVQVFELSGKFVTKFGSEGSGRGELNYPISTANLSDGRIVVSDMENNQIQTLLDNLHDEVSCSVCMCTFTDPKQLPCLHSFCLHCLNGIQRTSGLHGKITCPECRRQFQISGSGNPSELPTNFRINSLLDVLAIKECSTVNVKCRNCEKRSAKTLYCFQCCSFWCEECIVGHNIMRENKDHRTLALKDFQDQDIKAVLERPAFCQKKHRENKELELFCKDCKVAICSACAMTLHDNHVKMLLQEATDARKTQIKSIIKSLKDKEVEKQEEVEQFNQKSIAFQSKVAEVKSQVQSCVDQIIAIIEARKQDIFDVIDNQAKKSLESFSHKKDELNKQVKLIELAIEQAETLLKQSFSTEILGFSETFDSILQEQSTQENRDTECIPRFSFTKSKKLINLLSMSEGIGKVEFVFSEIKAQQLGTKGKESSKVIAGNKGANVHDSPFEAQVQTRCFRSVLSFGRKGKSVGMLNSPWGVAVNDQDEIAVTEYLNHRVSVFSSDGIHLRSFGRCGDNKGEFWYPKGIAFDSHGNIVVADCWNHRVQVFDWNGNFLSMFGVNQLQYPAGLSINGNGDIIVADGRNILIKIFSSSGEYLRKFSGAGSLVSPIHCIQHGQYFIVLDFGDHSIKIFSLEERFISKFGKRGNKDGEFNKPRYLSVNKEGLLMVCDEKNHRVQVFELSGKFVTKFGSEGSGRGELNYPISTANLSDGRIVVSDMENNQIQVFDKI
ncbi:unnamed protein product [Porites evermanni]|uniref:E3 ubiquitin-protein ligase TRIM71 n=1 Tax=Porites evermanni TaxID=104178 RepID=A0ABN8MGD4_9CNID|nr:unnamed protein product [Porites evermanni]